MARDFVKLGFTLAPELIGAALGALGGTGLGAWGLPRREDEPLWQYIAKLLGLGAAGAGVGYLGGRYAYPKVHATVHDWLTTSDEEKAEAAQSEATRAVARGVYETIKDFPPDERDAVITDALQYHPDLARVVRRMAFIDDLTSAPTIGAAIGGLAAPAVGAYAMKRRKKKVPTVDYLATLLGLGAAGAGAGYAAGKYVPAGARKAYGWAKEKAKGKDEKKKEEKKE